MRKLFITLGILVVLLVVLDRAGLAIAEREIGSRVQSAYHLPERPGVSVRGFPFLTQVVSGQYQEIDVSIKSASAGGVRLQDIQARFTGVHASLSLLLGHGSSLLVTGKTPLGSVRTAVSLAVTRTGISVSADVFGTRLSYVIPVGQLPLHLTVSGVHVASGGLVISATGRNVAFASA